jgi:mannose-6-phosphate isomerase-like protein (cupin superfamily)
LSPEDAGDHHGISASPFVTRQDYPTLSHKGNSSIAWIALQQYDADPRITATPVHSHATSEQAFYLLEGRAEFVVGDTEQEVGAGELVFAPRHVRHGYKVLGEVPVKWLMMGWSSQ